MGFQDSSNFQNERDIVYSRYHSKINMSEEELIEFLKDKKADRRLVNQNLNLLNKGKSLWGKREIRQAKESLSGITSGKKDLRNYALDKNK